MFSPEEQRIIDERWKQYDTEWKQPQTMSRDPTALEIEKFRYETEARYREDQLRASRPSPLKNEFRNEISSELAHHYESMGYAHLEGRKKFEDESRRIEDGFSRLRARRIRDDLRYRYNVIIGSWFAFGVLTTLILVYILK